jgi:NAD(P)-dependent dehydrogenase (short-subunit alcohol dehydrogenase family)
MRFEGKAALVTGAGSGIGRATALRLASEGAQVLVVDLNDAHAGETVAAIEKAGGRARTQKTDVGDPAQVAAAVAALVRWLGRVDVLVNDAAMMVFKPVVELPVEDWDRVQAVNLRAVFLFCKHALPHMKGGAVVNVSSVHAHETTANVSSYAASKGGIEAFTRALSREVKPAQARVNSIAPGAADTPMLWSNPNLKSGAEHLEGAVAKPEWIASAIAFLASGEARFIHGTTLVVDGGRLDAL